MGGRRQQHGNQYGRQELYPFAAVEAFLTGVGMEGDVTFAISGGHAGGPWGSDLHLPHSEEPGSYVEKQLLWDPYHGLFPQ